jgi:hypothetical protein
LALSHESLVQTLLSLQLTVVGPLHVPPVQTSPDVHASESLHTVASGLFDQPVLVEVGRHSWHWFPGFVVAAAMQFDEIRHHPSLTGFEHPPSPSQASSVQSFPSPHP